MNGPSICSLHELLGVTGAFSLGFRQRSSRGQRRIYELLQGDCPESVHKKASPTGVASYRRTNLAYPSEKNVLMSYRLHISRQAVLHATAVVALLASIFIIVVFICDLIQFSRTRDTHVIFDLALIPIAWLALRRNLWLQTKGFICTNAGMEFTTLLGKKVFIPWQEISSLKSYNPIEFPKWGGTFMISSAKHKSLFITMPYKVRDRLVELLHETSDARVVGPWPWNK